MFNYINTVKIYSYEDILQSLPNFLNQNRNDVHNNFSRLAIDSFNPDMDGNPHSFSKEEIENIFKNI